MAKEYTWSGRVKTRLQKRDWDAPVLNLAQGTAAVLIDRASGNWASGNFIGKVFLCSQADWAMGGDRRAYKMDKRYTKALDATDLSGTRDKEVSPLPRTFELMLKSFVPEKRIDEQEGDKVPFLVIRKIRNAILNETFKPGERLPEAELGEMFEVSRSPVREALLALEKEGTVTMEPYKGAIVKPLSAEEALDIAEVRLALITLAAKGAYRHLSPADFDLAYGLGKQITRSNSAKEQFEYNRRFWDIIFEKTGRPILWEVFTRLDDRLIRYHPLVLKLFPDPATRPPQQEALIEHYRKGKVDEAVRAFKKIYLEVVHQIIDHLGTEGSASAGK